MPEPTVFDEDTNAWTHGPGIADLSGGVYDATAEGAINDILAALRSAGIIAQD